MPNINFKIVVEIPKGSDRRIHMRYDGSGFEDFGPIKERIPVNDGVMPVDYGYVIGAKNQQEKDDVDAVIFSTRKYATGDWIDAKAIGLLKREDRDHKVVMVDDTLRYDSLDDIPAADKSLMLEFFGYGHTIVEESAEIAVRYIADCTGDQVY